MDTVDILYPGDQAGPCDTCYYPLYAGDCRSAVFRIHTNLNSKCIDPVKVQTCTEDGKTYWLVEKIGNFKQKLEGECPVKEAWICTERDSGDKVIKGRISEPDIIKEKEITGLVRVGMEKECITRNPNPFLGISGISKFWRQIGQRGPNFWEAPEGLFWLCRETAYVTLPGEWAGSCILGIIHPSFFLLPQNLGRELGVPL